MHINFFVQDLFFVQYFAHRQWGAEELRKSAAFLEECCPDESLASEVVQFAAMMKNILSKTDDSTHGLELKLFTWWSYSLMLKYCLLMFVTNCTGEWSFSKLKLILNHLRDTMGQQRLSSLSLRSIWKTIDVKDVNKLISYKQSVYSIYINLHSSVQLILLLCYAATVPHRATWCR